MVFSGTLEPSPDRRVIRDDPVGQLAALKAEEGGDIMLSCGPRTLSPLATAPDRIDEYLVIIHPAVIAGGLGMFDGLEKDLRLELIEGGPSTTAPSSGATRSCRPNPLRARPT